MVSFNEMTIVGRVFSALIDSLSIVLGYAIGSRVFNKPVGLLAAAFSAFTVLNIQQSHFFTMDTFTSFFTLLPVYFAVRVSLLAREVNRASPAGGDVDSSISPEAESLPPDTFLSRFSKFIKHPCFVFSIAFGVALGCAVTSKLNSAPVAFLLPLAFGLFVWKKPAHEGPSWFLKAVIYLGIAAFISILGSELHRVLKANY